MAFFLRREYLSFQVLPKVYLVFFCERFDAAFRLKNQHGPDYQPPWGRGCLSEISSTVNL